ncbi:MULTISPECIES: hypothetical protein [unclassified Nocardiopsis]|uniref:hypothetical protein n=1 Tax=Nocardiopsis TaxID=2013 RepID=UPI00387AB6A5
MSNPTFATKVVTLFKGLFGRKETVAAPAPAAEETAAAPAKTEEKAPAAEPAVEETTEAKAEEAEEAKAEEPAEEPAAAVEETVVEEVVVEEAVEETTPATADLPDSGESIAEEIAVAEAKTEVADSEVLEKVRKENAPAAEDLAVPTYDELTLPSVRARLRKLTVEQVRDLRAYEVAHQGRAEFIKMYDNRIAKLEDTDS